MVWRIRLVIDDGNPYYQMALDEALLILRSVNVIPDTLRLYVFNPSSVSIGYFQSLKRTVNIDQTVKLNIPIVRRITGGGAVYHDVNGEITYSLVSTLDRIPHDIAESYRFITMGVVYAAKYLGVNAEFKPVNDVVVDGRKFSGQAQIRRRGTVLQHGTFMYATNLDILASVLRVPQVKLRDKGVSSIRERVTTISEVLGRRVSRSEAIEALKYGFSKALDAELYEDKLKPVEVELAKSLEWKYRSREWLELRP
ncbi:MAG TPA: lipoate--protein ligase family protein [Desulfurococcales archaeon]|nr:lipoate--protein ligase family protein [Desulfurococcales archaeon]